MSTDAHFLVKIGFKFESLGKISNISAADSPVLLGQFQHCMTPCRAASVQTGITINVAYFSTVTSHESAHSSSNKTCYKPTSFAFAPRSCWQRQATTESLFIGLDGAFSDVHVQSQAPYSVSKHVTVAG